MTNKTNRTQILFLSLITVVACFLPIFTLSATPVDLAKKSEVSQKYYEGTLYAVALGEESEYDLAEDDETLEALDKKYEEIEALLDRIEKNEAVKITANPFGILIETLYQDSSFAKFRSIVLNAATAKDLTEKIAKLELSNLFNNLTSQEKELLKEYETELKKVAESLESADFCVVTDENIKKTMVMMNYISLVDVTGDFGPAFYVTRFLMLILMALTPILALFNLVRLAFAFAESNEERKNAKIKRRELTIYKCFAFMLFSAVIFKWIHVSVSGLLALVTILVSFVYGILKNRTTLAQEEKKHMDITALGSAMLLLGHALFCVGAFGFGLFEHAVLSENVYKNDFALYSATFVIIFGALFFFLSSAIVTAIDRVACEYRYSQNALSYSTAYMVWMSILSLILLFAGVSMPIFPFLLVIVGTAAVCSVNFVLPILYEKHAKETRKLFEEEEAVLTVFMKNKNLTDISQAREMRNRSKSASEILNSEDQ